jgi:hypothetical protein
VLASLLFFASPKPVMRDFIGLDVHTVQFRPDLYAPVAKRLRDYHGFDWDVGQDTSTPAKYPMSQNGVNWEELYGGWVRKGFTIDCTIQFEQIQPDKWKDLPRDAEAFGEAFARFFGPSGKGLVEAAEIGNEPGKYDDAKYRTLFERAATGMRRGDPKLKVATCATFDRASGDYHKSLETVRGLDRLYDVLNVHSYPQSEGWPTWRRSYPEDPKLAFLRDIQGVIDWGKRNAPGKEVWLTEFGWDSSTKLPDKNGPMKDWVGVTDLQQARYIVRAYLRFSAMDLDRAYLFWFNDEDQPSLHAASGLTRGYRPKPSYHAVAQLQRVLGAYRFDKVVRQTPEAYVYQYRQGRNIVWAAWSPTGTDRVAVTKLPKGPGKVAGVESLFPEEKPPVPKAGKDGSLECTLSESPIYIRFKG